MNIRISRYANWRNAVKLFYYLALICCCVTMMPGLLLQALLFILLQVVEALNTPLSLLHDALTKRLAILYLEEDEAMRVLAGNSDRKT